MKVALACAAMSFGPVWWARMVRGKLAFVFETGYLIPLAVGEWVAQRLLPDVADFPALKLRSIGVT